MCMYIHAHVFSCVLMCDIGLFLPNCFSNFSVKFCFGVFGSFMFSVGNLYTFVFPVDFIIIFNIAFLLYRLCVLRVMRDVFNK